MVPAYCLTGSYMYGNGMRGKFAYGSNERDVRNCISRPTLIWKWWTVSCCHIWTGFCLLVLHSPNYYKGNEENLFTYLFRNDGNLKVCPLSYCKRFDCTWLVFSVYCANKMRDIALNEYLFCSFLSRCPRFLLNPVNSTQLVGNVWAQEILTAVGVLCTIRKSSITWSLFS